MTRAVRAGLPRDSVKTHASIDSNQGTGKALLFSVVL